MGRNDQEKMQNIFSLSLVLSVGIGLLFILFYLPLGILEGCRASL